MSPQPSLLSEIREMGWARFVLGSTATTLVMGGFLKFGAVGFVIAAALMGAK